MSNTRKFISIEMHRRHYLYTMRSNIKHSKQWACYEWEIKLKCKLLCDAMHWLCKSTHVPHPPDSPNQLSYYYHHCNFICWKNLPIEFHEPLNYFCHKSNGLFDRVQPEYWFLPSTEINISHNEKWYLYQNRKYQLAFLGMSG